MPMPMAPSGGLQKQVARLTGETTQGSPGLEDLAGGLLSTSLVFINRKPGKWSSSRAWSKVVSKGRSAFVWSIGEAGEWPSSAVVDAGVLTVGDVWAPTPSPNSGRVV
jgi:hypothetical protein